MDFPSGDKKSKGTEHPVVKPQAKLFFINNELVRVIHINRAQNFIKIFNIPQDKYQSMLYTDFVKHRKRAYLKKDAAKILGKSSSQFDRYIYSDLIDRPHGTAPGGARAWHFKSYYSEDQIFQIREALSHIHRGRPRKDGLITSTIISEQELRIRMGDAMMLYTKNSDGELVPVWSETI